jgi:DNA-binding MarR family transcriptional regulator
VTAHAELAADLLGVIGRFRRQLRRAAGRGFDTERLSESQAELLRLVGRRPDISVNTAASELGLVPNSASTLVSKLASDGLLLRTVDTADRRVGRLRLTGSAQHVVDASRTARRAVLAEVLGELDQGRLEALTKGLEVLGEMTRMLQERQP